MLSARASWNAGVDVVDIGQVGTEEVYFATFALALDGGAMVTASHNPKDYNGMKFTRDLARPISADTGLLDIERAVIAALAEGGGAAGARATDRPAGSIEKIDNRSRYVDHLLSYVDISSLRPLKVVVNPGNGGAGAVLQLLEQRLPFEFVKLNFEADGSFPNGVPNPLLPENRAVTAEAVLSAGADLGLAWDGDFDRCFFFDEKGEFIEGYYLVGLLAQRALKRHPGANIIHDPRLIWNTLEMVEEAGGVPVLSQERPRFHQREDEAGGRRLRGRDVRPSLLQGVLLLRQRHDPLAAGGRDPQHRRTAAVGLGGGADRSLSGER